MAKDGGSPPKTATSSVLISVNRNLFVPLFEPQRIDLQLLETAELGVPIVRVNATDKDTKVSQLINIFN